MRYPHGIAVSACHILQEIRHSGMQFTRGFAAQGAKGGALLRAAADERVIAMLGENLVAGQAFPLAPMLFHQPRIQNGIGQGQSLGGLARAQQGAGIDTVCRERQSQRRHPGETRAAQRNVGMALNPSRRIPVGGAVAQQR